MSTGIYTVHRENQREWILETAEDLFIKKGVEQVTIGDIAAASRLTRATIYKYFTNKEQMAAEIFKSITKGWVERDQREVWSCAGTGCELVERFVNSHFNYLFQNPREARFLAEFNYIYARQWSAETALTLFAENLAGERGKLLASIRRGQTDGSLRSDIPADLILASILNFNSGMASRLGELGAKLDTEFGNSSPDIFTQTCRIFLDGLKTRAPLQ